MLGLINRLFQPLRLDAERINLQQQGPKMSDRIGGFLREARYPMLYGATTGYLASGGYALASGLALPAAGPLILFGTLLGLLAYPAYRLFRYAYNKISQPRSETSQQIYA